MEHAWATYENSDATRVLKQHCYVNKQCGKFWETPYMGAKALCGAGGVSEDGDLVEWSDVEAIINKYLNP